MKCYMYVYYISYDLDKTVSFSVLCDFII
jgi:hypothetical protein